MKKSLVILNCIDNLDEIIASLGLSSDTVEILENEYPIIIQPFDNLIRTLLIKITTQDIKNIYFVIDPNQLENHMMLDWIDYPDVREAVELFDYLKLPGSEAIQTWFNPKNIDAEFDKSITMLKKHPLLPKDVSYSYRILEKN